MRTIVLSLALLGTIGMATGGGNQQRPADAVWTDGSLLWSISTRAEGARDLDLAVDGRSIMAKGASLRLFSLTHDGQRVHFSDLQDARIDRDGPNLRATGTVPGDLPALRVTLMWQAAKAGQTRVSLELENLDTQPVHWQAAFPVANDLRLGPAGQEGYFYPARSGVLSDAPLHALNPYGGRLWWQVMAVYDEASDLGLSLWPEDATGLYKDLEFLKPALPGKEIFREFRIPSSDMRGRDFGALHDTNGIGMAVYHVTVPLQPKARYSPPPAIWLAHGGHWREGVDAYVAWVRTWYKKDRRPPEWWKRVFSHAAAHPQHWHGDNEQEQPGDFTLADQVWPGLCVQLWGYWHLPKTTADGQPISDPIHAGEGAYDKYREEYGDAAAIRAEVNRCRQRGAWVTAYLEGVWMSLQSRPGNDDWRKWGLMSGPGEYDFRDRGGPTTRLYRMCPAHPGWQDHLARQSAAVLRDLDLDGIYLDSITSGAVRLCLNPAHEHPHPGVWMQGTADLARKVRAAMDRVKPDAVLYTEEPCCDYLTQFFDGALSHATWYNLCGVEEIHPSGVDLFSFYFPDFRYVDIPSYGFSPEAIGRAFFNGHGVHRFVNQHEHDALVRPWEKLMSKCADAFTSSDAVPLVPTAAKGIYANRFPGKGYTLHTLRNGTGEEVSGAFLKLPLKRGARYLDALTGNDLKLSRNGNSVALLGTLAPRNVACWAVVDRGTQWLLPPVRKQGH